MGPRCTHRHAAPVPLQRLLSALVCLLHLSRAYSLYHTSSETLHWFSHSAAKHSSLLRFREFRQRHSHTFIPVATITAGADVAVSQRNKPVVMLIFGEHAREVITSEVGIWLTRILIDNSSDIYKWPELSEAMQRAQSNSSSSSSDLDHDHWSDQIKVMVSKVLADLEIQIVPIETLDSRRQVEEGQLCVRKTSSNVDLNRNWPFAWRHESPSDEQYGGPGPLSEPQSRLMKQLIDSHDSRLLGYINVHSGESALYTPWDSKPAYAPDLPADLPQLVAQIGRLCECKAGPAGAVSGYLAFGSSMDYVYMMKKVPYPLTVEVYGGGDIGKLQPGETNKLLTDFPVMEKSTAGAAAAAAPSAANSRGLLQRQQQQQWPREDWRNGAAKKQQLLPQQCVIGRQQQQQRWVQRIWWLWTCIRHRLLLGMQQRQQQQRGPVSDSNRSAGSGRPAAAVGLDSTRLSRRMSLLQLTEQQLTQQQQQRHGSATGDGILDTVETASDSNKACFYAFNPQTEDIYRRVVADWVVAFVLMLHHMADSQAYKSMAAAAAAGGADNG